MSKYLAYGNFVSFKQVFKVPSEFYLRVISHIEHVQDTQALVVIHGGRVMFEILSFVLFPSGCRMIYFATLIQLLVSQGRQLNIQMFK